MSPNLETPPFRIPAWLILSASILSVLLGASCADVPDGVIAPPPPMTPAARLWPSTTEALALSFAEDVELGFRYTEDDGTPIADAPISLAMVGNANDSSLSVLEVVTDAAGEVSVTLVAASAVSSFRVRATAERAASAQIDVSVSNRGFGSLVVSLSGGDSRPIANEIVGLFSDARCEDEGLLSARADRLLMADSTTRDVEFASLPAGVSFAVLAEGLSESGDVLTRGCLDGVTLEPESEKSVELELMDVPLLLTPEYVMEAAFSSTSSAELLSERTLATLDPFRDRPDRVGALFLDAMEEARMAAGDPDAALQLSAARRAEMLDRDLADRLSIGTESPEAAITALATLLSTNLSELSLFGTLSAEGTSFSWTTNTVAVHGSALDAPSYLLDAGTGREATRIDIAFDAGGGVLTIVDLATELPLGAMGQALLSEIADARDLERPALLLRESLGCETVSRWVRERSQLSDHCDTDCVASACEIVERQLLESVTASLSTADVERATFELSGDLQANLDQTQVMEFSGLDVFGRWVSEDGEAFHEVEVDMSGRTPPE